MGAESCGRRAGLEEGVKMGEIRRGLILGFVGIGS